MKPNLEQILTIFLLKSGKIISILIEITKEHKFYSLLKNNSQILGRIAHFTKSLQFPLFLFLS
jgi:hypothetical protein